MRGGGKRERGEEGRRRGGEGQWRGDGTEGKGGGGRRKGASKEIVPTLLSHFQDMAELVKKEPSHVTLEWVLRLIQHILESDPDQIFIVDLVPNLKWLMRDEHLIKECGTELAAFEQKVCLLQICVCVWLQHLTADKDPGLNLTCCLTDQVLSLPRLH